MVLQKGDFVPNYADNGATKVPRAEISLIGINTEYDLTDSFVHNVENREVFGTVWPNGLNMVRGGTGHQTGAINAFSIFEVLCLATLGIKGTEIARILSEFKEIRITSATLSEKISASEYGDWKTLQKFTLKPVLFSLISDSNLLTHSQIAKVLTMSPTTLTGKVDSWFEGTSFKELRDLTKATDVDLDTLSELTSDVLEIFRGHDPEDVKTWLMDITIENKELAKNFGVGVTTLWRMMKDISVYFTNEEMGTKELQRHLQKHESIRLLREGIRPEVILRDHFHYSITYERKTGTIVSKSAVRKIFENIFADTHMRFEGIIHSYFANPAKLMKMYNTDGWAIYMDK